MKQLLFTILSVVIFTASCQKEPIYLDAGGDISISLEGTKWKVTSAIVGEEVDGQKSEEDILAIAEPCSKDNIILFNKGGVFIMDEGPTKCEPTDPQQEIGQWALSTDHKKLTLLSEAFNNDPDPVVYDITQTGNNLTLTYKEGLMITIGNKTVKTDLYVIMVLSPQN